MLLRAALTDSGWPCTGAGPLSEVALDGVGVGRVLAVDRPLGVARQQFEDLAIVPAPSGHDLAPHTLRHVPQQCRHHLILLQLALCWKVGRVEYGREATSQRSDSMHGNLEQHRRASRGAVDPRHLRQVSDHTEFFHQRSLLSGFPTSALLHTTSIVFSTPEWLCVNVCTCGTPTWTGLVVRPGRLLWPDLASQIASSMCVCERECGWCPRVSWTQPGVRILLSPLTLCPNERRCMSVSRSLG